MRACAELVVGPGSVVARLVDAPPVAFRPTPQGVFLVGTAASPVGDDDVTVTVEVTAGGELTVRSSAATVVYAGDGSRWEVRATAGTGSTLVWEPEPLIVTAGASHRQRTTVACAADAAVDWTEVTVLGRHGEDPGRAVLRLDVDVAGRPLLRHELRLGPDAPGWEGPAVLGPHRAVASRVVTAPGLRPPQRRQGPGWAWLELEGAGWLLVAAAPSLPELRHALTTAEPPRPAST